MGFNEFISKLFGNKATRDMKEIQPWVNKVKEVYPEIAKLSHDELRAKTEELKNISKNRLLRRIKDRRTEGYYRRNRYRETRTYFRSD